MSLATLDKLTWLALVQYNSSRWGSATALFTDQSASVYSYVLACAGVALAWFSNLLAGFNVWVVQDVCLLHGVAVENRLGKHCW